VSNGDLIMALFSKNPTRTWGRVNMKEALKLSDDAFNEAARGLSESEWVELDPATKLIRTGAGVGNGYWLGDDNRFKAALKAPEDRTGAGVGNG
jgi:hypothetical protein